MVSTMRVIEALRELGVPADLKGYKCLVEAMKYVNVHPNLYNMSMTKELYPAVAAVMGTTASRVERAMRHAIEVVFNNTNSETLYEYFGNTPKFNSGKLTNREFVYGLLEYLNNEVKK